LFGNSSFETINGGTGSGDVNEAYSISLMEGLKSAGYSINNELQKLYGAHIQKAKEKRPQTQAFMSPAPIAELPVDAAMANKMAAATDAALITIGRNSGEFFDRRVEGDFNLTAAEIALIRDVSSAFHSKGKKAIVVLNIGGVVETESWRNLPDGILLAWQAGQECGHSIADVISGKVNPSGRLATTFPVRYGDVPSSRSFPGNPIEKAKTGSHASGQADGLSLFKNPTPSRITYEEGIYVGYRYYETAGVKPAYEFGYGMSYTSFEYGRPSLSSQKFSGELAVTLDVKNIGKLAGKEVVQLYITAPAHKQDKPAIELKAFAKSRLLSPGESQTLKFILKPRQLSSFNPVSSSWIAEAGKYDVRIGASSRDIRQTASFTLDNDLMVKKESVALAPKAKINELRPR
jgi:beta-glucosidase